MALIRILLGKLILWYWQLNSVEREELDADLHATALLHSANALTLRFR
jgi:hypothetical protein